MPARLSASRPCLFVEPLESRELLAAFCTGAFDPPDRGPAPGGRFARDEVAPRQHFTRADGEQVTTRSEPLRIVREAPTAALTGGNDQATPVSDRVFVALGQAAPSDRLAGLWTEPDADAGRIVTPVPVPFVPYARLTESMTSVPLFAARGRVRGGSGIELEGPSETVPSVPGAEPGGPAHPTPDDANRSEQPPPPQATGLLSAGVGVDLSAFEDAVRAMLVPGDREASEGSFLGRVVGVSCWVLAAVFACMAVRQRTRAAIFLDPETTRDRRPT